MWVRLPPVAFMEEPKKIEHDANGCYINWEAIRSMTEEEAEEMWNDLRETFPRRDVSKKDDTDKNEVK